MRKLDILTLIAILGLSLPLLPFSIKNECIAGNKQSLISFTVDDGYKSWVDYIDPILEKYNLTITAFITDIENGKIAQCLTLNYTMVIQLNKTGRWEFGWHTIDHPFLKNLNFTEKERQISCWQTLEEHGLPPPKTFAYPYGTYDYESISIASKYFLAARTATEGINTVSSIRENPMEIRVCRISHKRDNDYYKAKVMEALGKGEFLVFYFHSVEEAPEDTLHLGQVLPVEITKDNFEKLIRWIASFCEGFNIKVVTFSEGVKEMRKRTYHKNIDVILANSLETSTYYGIPYPKRYLQVVVSAVNFLGRLFPSLADAIVPYMVPMVVVTFIIVLFFLILRIALTLKSRGGRNSGYT